MDVLRREGHGGLKADRLAKALNVTRGSFYWHFNSLKDFHTALLDTWRQDVTEAAITELSELPENRTQLTTLLSRSLKAPQDAEAAMRSWALVDPLVAQALIEVDNLRVGYLTELFVGEGISLEIAKSRAIVLCWAAAGHAMAPTFTDQLAEQSAEDLSTLFLKTPNKDFL